MLNSVYMVRDDETTMPPERVMKVSLFSGGYMAGTREYMPPAVYFAIGDFDEGTYEDSFESSAERQFSVTLRDLVLALRGLGAVEYVSLAPELTLEDGSNAA